MEKIYLKDKKRLAIFGHKADPDYWDSHWEIADLAAYVRSHTSDGLFIPAVKKYLPPGASVLEGGCGRGQLVYALMHSGYAATGIDFAEKTVAKLNSAVPELDIRTGDVRNLPLEDNSFDGYISVGVIEHFADGYGAIICEMHRVLKPGGLLFITFPFMSLLRKIKAFFGIYRSVSGFPGKDDFYQFMLNPTDVIKDLEKTGFKLIVSKNYDGIKGFKDETVLFRKTLQDIYDGKKMQKIRPFLLNFLAPFAGHVKFMILKKQ